MNVPIGSIVLVALYNEHGIVVGVDPDKNPYGCDISWYHFRLFNGKSVSLSILDYDKKWWIVDGLQ